MLTSPAQSQASTSGSNQQFQSDRGNQKQKQQQQQQQKESEQQQQQTQWDFRVMTYNILAEGLVHTHSHSHCHYQLYMAFVLLKGCSDRFPARSFHFVRTVLGGYIAAHPAEQAIYAVAFACLHYCSAFLRARSHLGPYLCIGVSDAISRPEKFLPYAKCQPSPSIIAVAPQATAHGELLYQQVPAWCLKCQP